MQNEYFDNDIYQLYLSITKLQSSVATNSRLAAIGQTTQLLAHDIRTPLSQILMLINYFEMDQCDPNIIQTAKLAVRKSINHAESMVNDIMDYSREICLTTSAVPIGYLINSVLTRTLQANPQDQIAFLYDFTAQYMPLVEQDRVERALGNIIGNAIEAITIIGGKDNGTISISSRGTVINDKKMVEIVIGNDGPPFAEGSTEKMFDSFYTHGKSKGTGLGLASAKKIIDLHQGNIISRNKADGKGVEFVINLPASDKAEIMMFDVLPQNSHVVCRAQPKNDLNIKQLIQTMKNNETIYRIILLEDDVLYRAVIKNLINTDSVLSKQIIIYDANTVNEAVELMQNESISHAIVDIDLGNNNLDGYEFLRIARDKYPSLSCLVHSNRTIDEYKEKAIALGAKRFVPKPLTLPSLIEFLQEGDKGSKSEKLD